jgi:type IV pilus assembly protein PilW
MIYSNINRTTQKKSPHKQSGMSLIEVMVAMTIGLIILIALGYFFLSSTRINRTTDDVSRMQESGRNTLELMGKAVRQAGYRRDVDEKFGGSAGALVMEGTNGSGTAADSITVRYNAQEDGDVDCTGTIVPAGTDESPNMVTATFAISGGALTCNNGTSTVTLVDNIEDMQIGYGIDSERDGAIDAAYINNPTATQFAQVAAVQVTLLTKGPSKNVTTNSQTLSYNGADITKSDGHLYQVYSATFTVRNQAW